MVSLVSFLISFLSISFFLNLPEVLRIQRPYSPRLFSFRVELESEPRSIWIQSLCPLFSYHIFSIANFMSYLESRNLSSRGSHVSFMTVSKNKTTRSSFSSPWCLLQNELGFSLLGTRLLILTIKVGFDMSPPSSQGYIARAPLPLVQ